MSKSGRYFLFLGIAQALHSIEEIYFHLYDFTAASLATPAFITSFSQLRMKSEIFAIVNIIIIVLILASVPFYETRRRWAVSAAWFWACAEVLNGLGHLTAAIVFFRYFPGSLSAPILVLSGLLLLYQLYHA